MEVAAEGAMKKASVEEMEKAASRDAKRRGDAPC